ncbi:hypothetical protein [Conexivisphaera calida]|uniref:MFS transporter n=1 Tax=Conexivisphaera calida TaxID=1874277 RepID=A0A4P2VLK4_9ARCH|nr:hypothetical protein [Conexivisphaera calida]BBE42025.1 hypothetical protein NAS2_0636 [Conexivisphaera calida]
MMEGDSAPRRALKVAIPLLGFLAAALLTSSLSTYILYLGYFHARIGASIPWLALWGSVFYFAGMPLGKVVGRALKFYRHLPSAVVGMSALIAASLVLMPYVSSSPELLSLRLIQGMVTFYMEVFSNAHSYLYSDLGHRTLASAVSIAGIPGGVAIGTSAYLAAPPSVAYAALAAISLVAAAAYAAVLSRVRTSLAPLSRESGGSTFRMGRTWLMGTLWGTVTGDLTLAVALQPLVSSYAPADVPLAIGTFGISGVLMTAAAGIVAYFVRSPRHMTRIISVGYAISAASFLYILMFRPVGAYLVAAIVLTDLMNLAIPFIYSVPRHVYREGYVGKGTWEFSMIGSFYHIWFTALALGLIYGIGFAAGVSSFVALMLYGMVATLVLPRLFVH